MDKDQYLDIGIIIILYGLPVMLVKDQVLFGVNMRKQYIPALTGTDQSWVIETPWIILIVSYLVYVLAIPFYIFYHDSILDWCVNYQLNHSIYTEIK
jgi:hypothetical protein